MHEGRPFRTARQGGRRTVVRFWRFLSSAAHEKSIWVPYLHHAFPAGTDRKDDVDDRITRLHGLRNRVAHHEPLLGQRVRDDYAALISLATLILPPLAQHIAATSAVVRILSRKP